MNHTVTKAVLLWIIVLAFSTRASAFTLDVEGQGCYSTFTCTVTSVKLKTYTTKKSLYDLEALCGYPSTECGAYPPPWPVQGTLEWIRAENLNVATEIFYSNGQQDDNNTSKWEANTTSKCPQNPWTNESVPCTVVIKNFRNPQFNSFTGPYPISALLMTSAQKLSLNQEEAQTTPIIIAPPAPQIVKPNQDQIFIAPAKVAIEVKHDPVYAVVFEFMWKKPQQGGWPENYQPIEGIVLDNVMRSNGVTSAELTIGKTGQWMLRAKANFPGAKWSEIEFVVDEPQQLLQPIKQPIQLKKIQ